jgi:hypothetical protein
MIARIVAAARPLAVVTLAGLLLAGVVTAAQAQTAPNKIKVAIGASGL